MFWLKSFVYIRNVNDLENAKIPVRIKNFGLNLILLFSPHKKTYLFIWYFKSPWNENGGFGDF